MGIMRAVARSLEELQASIRDIPNDTLFPLEVTIKPFRKNRSLAINRLLHKWIAAIAKQKGESPEDEKCYFKLMHCIPVLRGDRDFNDYYLVVLDNLSHSERLLAMKYITASSVMTNKQLVLAMHHYERECIDNQLSLPHPEDDEYEAMGYTTTSVSRPPEQTRKSL